MELHEIAESPNWDTKQHCTCGFESVSKCEQWKHASDELRAQVETAERQRDELATVLGRLTDCIIENGHGFRLDRYDQVCVAMNDAENALAALDTPPAKEATT